MNNQNNRFHATRIRVLTCLLLVGFLVTSCSGSTNTDVAMPTGNPLDFEPIPQLGLQTQSSSLAAWQPIIEEVYGDHRIDFDAVDVDVYGTGLGSRFAATSQATVYIPNPETVRRLYVQVVFKAGSLSNPINEFIAPEEIVLSTPVEQQSLSAGQLTLVPLTDDAGVVVNNTGRVYEAVLEPASYVSVNITKIRKFGTLYTPRALIVYAQREITDYANGTMSVGKVVNRYLHGHSGFEQATVSLDITGWGDWPSYVGIAVSDLEVTFALAELGSDSRHVILVAEAGGVRREVTLDHSTDGDEFSQYTLTLPDVPGTTNTVTATVISPKAQPGESVWDNGDSVFWHAVNVKTAYERPCLLDGYRLTTQAAVDAVLPCTMIVEDLYIGPEDPNDPITNLHGLSNLRQSERARIIQTSLRNLHGLENLTIYGSSHKSSALIISDNSLLENLDGLKGQMFFLGYVTISRNARLASISGLEGVQRVIPTIEIVGNPSLRTLEGLEDLMWSALYVKDNASLESITALVNLRGIESHPDDGNYVIIVDNPMLDCSLEPQPNILPVSSSGNLVDCPAITP